MQLLHDRYVGGRKGGDYMKKAIACLFIAALACACPLLALLLLLALGWFET